MSARQVPTIRPDLSIFGRRSGRIALSIYYLLQCSDLAVNENHFAAGGELLSGGHLRDWLHRDSRHCAWSFAAIDWAADFLSKAVWIVASRTNADHSGCRGRIRAREETGISICQAQLDLPSSAENSMRKTIAAIAAVTTLSLGSLVSAEAGGSSSAPSKYNNASYTASAAPTRNSKVHTVGYAITEFSSSSARTAPKR
jgi:hypothetical protein